MVVAEEEAAAGRWRWFTFFIEDFKTTLDLDFASDDDIWTRVCSPTTITLSFEVAHVDLESWEKPASMAKGFLKFLNIFLDFEGKKEVRRKLLVKRWVKQRDEMDI